MHPRPKRTQPAPSGEAHSHPAPTGAGPRTGSRRATPPQVRRRCSRRIRPRISVALVGEHYALHERVTHHVARAEEGEGHALDVAQHLDDMLETRALLTRQVDLGD